MHPESTAWQQLVYVCPSCSKEFRPMEHGLHVRLCPSCESGPRWATPKERAACLPKNDPLRTCYRIY